jgi:hypothetical protein
MTFEFREWGILTDRVVSLAVVKRESADPVRGYGPSYHFAISRHGIPGDVGTIPLRVESVRETPSLLTSGHVG